MITGKEFLKAQKIVEEWKEQIKHSNENRFFVDIRGGCGAVRDSWHESFDKDYPGLHSDTPDVIDYKHGFTDNGVWKMNDDDVDFLNKLCDNLNKNNHW